MSTLSLKEVDFDGFYPPMTKSKVAYVVDGYNIYFSGLERRKTSTINAAEEVILVLCRAEGLKWQNCQFYDIQTHLGYRKSPGEYIVDSLKVIRPSGGSPESLFVEAWRPMPPEQIPSEVLKLFEPLIH